MPALELVEWSDALLTGVPEMDQQHIGVLNEARTKLVLTEGRAVFERLTRDLLAYAIQHFETEERLMAQHGYAARAPEDAALHVREHRDFSKRVVMLRTEAESNWEKAGATLTLFLQDWLTHHILTLDKQLGRALRPRRLDPTSRR